MLHIEMPIIVEGKYDLIKLANITDAVLIKTNGFSIFKDREKQAQIRQLAGEKGVLVLTDSDSAGNLIRNFLKNLLGNEKVHHVFVPPIPGKEKRKSKPSAEGFLGVEGVQNNVLVQALERFSCTPSKNSNPAITTSALFELGLNGCADSRKLRQKVQAALGLPGSMSTGTFLKVLNTVTTLPELEELVKTCRNTQ